MTGALATAAGILLSFWALARSRSPRERPARRSAGASSSSAPASSPSSPRRGAVRLNLWGLFEIPLPRALARVGGRRRARGDAGHIVSGLFTTLMATPCSAPFLGTAVGFALAQRAGVILAVFTAIGVGMALPYLLLAVCPGAARCCPSRAPGWTR